MIRSTLGYVLTGLGIVGVAAWSIPTFKAAIPFLTVPALGSFSSDTVLLTASVVLAVLGLFLIKKGGGLRRAREVPIFHGKNVVGYRRH